MPSAMHPHHDPTVHLTGLPAPARSHPSAHFPFISSSTPTKNNMHHFDTSVMHEFLSRWLPERFYSSSIVYIQKDRYHKIEVQRMCTRDGFSNSRGNLLVLFKCHCQFSFL